MNEIMGKRYVGCIKVEEGVGGDGGNGLATIEVSQGEVMSNAEFISKLNKYIKFVFDHGQEFVFEFLPHYSGWDVDSFYMIGESCQVHLVDIGSGQDCTELIDTSDFIGWVDKHENNTSA